MALTKAEVRVVIERYIQAWVEQDPDLILTVFTESATYCERVFENPISSHKGIRHYWQEKVVEAQGRIECRLLNLYLDGSTAIAEWEACFDDLKQGVRKRMREVAILEFEGRLIQNLREYWSTQDIEPGQGRTDERSAPCVG